MPIWIPDDVSASDRACWKPLEVLAALVATDRSLPLVLPCDFMLMHGVDRPRWPRIYAYKHVWSRTYLHIDTDAVLYRPRPRPSKRGGGPHLVPTSDLAAIVRSLLLEECGEPGAEEGYCDFCRGILRSRPALPTGRSVPS